MMLHHPLWADVTWKGNHCQGNGSSAGRGAQRDIKGVSVTQSVKMSMQYQRECWFHNHLLEEALLQLDSSSQFPSAAKHWEFPQWLARLWEIPALANLPVGLSYNKQFYSKIIAGFGLNFQGETNKAQYKQKQHLAALSKQWKAKSAFKSQTEIPAGPL